MTDIEFWQAIYIASIKSGWIQDRARQMAAQAVIDFLDVLKVEPTK